MKKILILLSLLASAGMFAQQTKEQCQKKVVQLDSILRFRQYASAAPLLQELRKSCNSQRESFQKSGVDVLKYQVTQAKDETAKTKAVKELLGYYDEYGKVVPSRAKSAQMQKAMAMDELKQGTADEVFNLLDQAFTTGGDQFDDPAAIRKYFDLYIAKFKAGDEKYGIEKVLKLRDDIDARIKLLSVGFTEKQALPLKNVATSIDRRMLADVNCDVMSEYYLKTLPTKKTDTLWIKNSATRLISARCNTKAAEQFAEASYAVGPDFESAKALGNSALRRSKTADAVKYFTEAANMTQKSSEKAEMYFTLASKVHGNSNPAKALDAVNQSLKFEPKNGKAYIFIAQLYEKAGADCAPTEFEKKALNYLALEAIDKAEKASPSLKTGTANLRERYTAALPTKDEIKKAKMAGKQVAFKCWINQTITVPKP